jgi:hydroxymethylglutaryl-CoA synthase
MSVERDPRLLKPVQDVGIVGYGAYIPRYRLPASEIARVWKAGTGSLPIEEKAVAGLDEDVITMSIEAARNALARAEIDPTRIRAVWVGSESHPYAVKPTSTVVAYAFAIGMDTAQGRPGDALEYTAAAGGAAYLLGPAEESLAVFEGTYSYATDTPDFFRRANEKYPEHGERFTGEPAYFKHISEATKAILQIMEASPEDYRFAVFHQPNTKFPQRVARSLGFKPDQIQAGLLVPKIGNTYAGSSLVGLTAVLDIASPGDRILLVSYGSGAGSDAFSLVTTDSILERRDRAIHTQGYVGRRTEIDYATYTRFRGKLSMK